MDYPLIISIINEYLLDKHKCWSIRYDTSDHKYIISSYRFAEIVVDNDNNEFKVVTAKYTQGNFYKKGKATARVCRTLKANNVLYIHPVKALDNLSEIINMIETIATCI